MNNLIHPSCEQRKINRPQQKKEKLLQCHYYSLLIGVSVDVAQSWIEKRNVSVVNKFLQHMQHVQVYKIKLLKKYKLAYLSTLDLHQSVLTSGIWRQPGTNTNNNMLILIKDLSTNNWNILHTINLQNGVGGFLERM